jgi:ceramidase
MMNPIRQDQDYHRFADSRAVMGLDNAADVLSNIPFIVVGVMGLLMLWRRGGLRAYWVFFFAILATGFGSAYYHLAPDDGRLVWDRMPIAIAFMALLSAVVSEQVHAKGGNALLIPLVALGAASVWWWAKVDDLRPYLLVQYGGLAAIAGLCAWFPSRNRLMLAAAGIYGVAKACELNDRLIFELTAGALSGHTLKHVLAALALFVITWAFGQRKERTA